MVDIVELLKKGLKETHRRNNALCSEEDTKKYLAIEEALKMLLEIVENEDN